MLKYAYLADLAYAEQHDGASFTGLAGDTPCAVISRATTPQQRAHGSTIAELGRMPQLGAPALLVVGEVVRFADPIALAQEFRLPAISGESARAAATVFRGPRSLSTFATAEEPLS